MAKIAKTTARVAGVRQMVKKGNSYADDHPAVKAHPDLFETPEAAQKRQHRPTSTADLGDKSMSARKKVEKATAAPDEQRDADLTCDCGFVAKSPGGLGAHQRSHGDD